MMWNRKGAVTAIMAVGIGLTACDYTRVKSSPSTAATGAPTTPTTPTSTFAQLQTELFQPYCISCHGSSAPSGGVTLSSYGALASSVGLSGMPALTAGNSGQSGVWVQINEGLMPLTGAKPGAEIVALLKRWIDAGASQTALVAPDLNEDIPAAAEVDHD